MFSDVQDEFCVVKKILSRFEEWRGFYSDSYHNAYIALCLPKLLNPIIRHQLLGWNPLKVLKHMDTHTKTEADSYIHTAVNICLTVFLCVSVRMLVETLKISHGSQQWRPFVMDMAMRS